MQGERGNAPFPQGAGAPGGSRVDGLPSYREGESE